MKVLLTGCAGFIGSNFIKKICLDKEVKQEYKFIVIDSLTYAGNYQTIQKEIESNDHLEFEKIDIRDQKKIDDIFEKELFDGVINFAAESHVDQSIKNPNIFVETNVLGTLNLLNASQKLLKAKTNFRYLQVSTDEVYGSLSGGEPAFTESNPLTPNSPYSASKAGGDLLVRSFFETYGLPTLITRCSNNYGPYQLPEKLIPLMIDRARNDLQLPVYGKGLNIRDWIYVDDHIQGVWSVFTKGKPGEVYNLGGNSEVVNLDVVKMILRKMKKPDTLVSFVKDRLGHDFRYAVAFDKIKNDLDWQPKTNFEEGLSSTIDWYLENQNWVRQVKENSNLLF